MTLDDWWKLPPTYEERISKMKKQWKGFILHLPYYPEHDNNDYETPEVILKMIARRRKDIAQMMADPKFPKEEKMRLEFWSAYGDRLERHMLRLLYGG